jgi:hypothetical protein
MELENFYYAAFGRQQQNEKFRRAEEKLAKVLGSTDLTRIRRGIFMAAPSH